MQSLRFGIKKEKEVSECLVVTIDAPSDRVLFGNISTEMTWKSALYLVKGNERAAQDV